MSDAPAGNPEAQQAQQQEAHKASEQQTQQTGERAQVSKDVGEGGGGGGAERDSPPWSRSEAFRRRTRSENRPPVEVDPVEAFRRRVEPSSDVDQPADGRLVASDTATAPDFGTTRESGQARAGRGATPERDAPLSSLERYNRERITEPRQADEIRFPYDSSEPVTGDLQAWLASPDGQLARSDPRTRIIVHGLASRPGSESYNLRLSQQRGERVAADMEASGLITRSQIEVRAHGEGPARDATRSLMRPGEPGDRDKEDRRDDPSFRVVVIEVLPYTRDLEFQGDQIVGRRLTPERLTETYEGAEPVHRDTVRKVGEMIRDLVPLPDNPLLWDDPSADSLELGRQGLEVTKDVIEDLKDGPEGLVKLFGTIFGGMGWEILIRNPQRREVANRRRPLHRAAAAGVAEALDPSYSSTLWNRDTARESEIRVYERAKQLVGSLSENEKESLRIYVIASNLNRRFGPSVAEPHDILRRMNGSSYERAVFNTFTFERRFRME